MAENKTENASKSEIKGRVYSEEKAALKGAKVSCDGIETITLADGVYVLRGLLAGTYDVKVTLQGFKSEVKKIILGKEETAVLDFYLPTSTGSATIEGHVYDYDTKNPITKGGTVILVLPISNKYTHIDEKGHYALKNLPAGTYSISTSILKYEDSTTVLTVKEGESKLHDFYCNEDKVIEPAWG